MPLSPSEGKEPFKKRVLRKISEERYEHEEMHAYHHHSRHLFRDGIGTVHRVMTVAKASLGQSLHLSG